MIDLEEFIFTVFGEIPHKDRICVTVAREGDNGSYFANYAWSDKRRAAIEGGEPEPWYYCVSTVRYQGRGVPLNRRTESLSEACVVVLDDIGTKCDAPQVGASYVLESSEGNYQWGYLIEPFDVSTPEGAEHYDACIRGLAAAGLTDGGARGAWRVMRLPGSLHKTGFRSVVTEWNPDRIWTLDDLMTALGVAPAEKRARRVMEPGTLELKDVQDEVLDWLRDSGRLTGELNDRFVEVLCPWADVHTAGDGTAGYSPLGYGGMKDRGFSCFHDHCQMRGIADLTALMQAEQGAAADAAAGADVLPHLDVTGLPDVQMGKKGPLARQILTLPNLRWVLSSWGWSLSFNVKRDSIVLQTGNEVIGDSTHRFEQMRTRLLDELTRLGIAAIGRVDDVLLSLAVEDKFHPVEDYLLSLPAWSGEDYIGGLAATVDTDSELWQVYLRRWLVQVVDAVMRWREPPRQYPYVLTFTGAEGIGKSSWFARIAPDVMDCFLGDTALHLDHGGGKDSMLAVLAHTIVELGEVDSTFKKSEIGSLKNFLSRCLDKIRAPYARTAIERPRGTVFCATVNDPEFLQDSGANRRFMVVSVDAIRRDAGRDIGQVWAQALALWSAGESYWLTDDEAAAQAEDNQRYIMETATGAAIDEFFGDESRWEIPKTDWLPVNVLSIAKIVGISDSELRHPLGRKGIGAAMRRLFGKERSRVMGVKRCWVVPVRDGEFTRRGLVPPCGTMRAL